MIGLSTLTENVGFLVNPTRVKGYPMRETADNAQPDSGTDTDSSANILASADQILSSAEILADLARVRAVFQLRTIELVLREG